MAFPFADVRPDAVGGAEQVLSLIDRGLVAAGHRSIVVARSGSEVAGELIATRDWPSAIHVALRLHNVDVVHMHGLDFATYLPEAGPAVLATLHLPAPFYDAGVFHVARPRTWLNCVSQSQRRTCPESALIAGVVENGVALDALASRGCGEGGYCVAMGRICREKGYHLALEAAELAGVPLRLAGQVYPYPEHLRYWDELQPQLREPHRYVGPVGGVQKADLLARAQCLVVPSTVAETSSLVTMEAMACGTPVVALRSGALPELIDHGKTGYVVDDVPQMAEAIRATVHIDRDACRRVARDRFDAGRMIAAYLALYDRLRAAQAPGKNENVGVAG